VKSIPAADDLSAAFVARCLHAAGHPAAEVRNLEGKRIGTGQIGQCVRYALEFAGEPRDAPSTIIAKGPSDDPKSRQTGVQLRNYIKEVSFYRELQARLQIRTPRCFYAEIAGDGPEHLLLLEDMAPALPGDQLRGCSVEVARSAVRELVGLHAPTWCDPALTKLDWLGAPNPITVQIGRALYQHQLPIFLDRFGARLAPDEAAIIEQAAASEGPPFEALGEIFSAVHVDYRLDNLLIDETVSPASVAAVDWQSITLGNPLSDVAYFLGAGLLPEQRRRVEAEIVRDYHAALVAAGARGYDADQCWNDYRRGVFAGFAVTVVAAPMVEQTERGDEMFTAMARRHARHAIDLGSHEFLG